MIFASQIIPFPPLPPRFDSMITEPPSNYNSSSPCGFSLRRKDVYQLQRTFQVHSGRFISHCLSGVLDYGLVSQASSSQLCHQESDHPWEINKSYFENFKAKASLDHIGCHLERSCFGSHFSIGLLFNHQKLRHFHLLTGQS